MLKQHGFTRVTWLNAVDGKTLSPAPPWKVESLPSAQPWKEWADPYARRAMTLGEVGCALSHVLAWQHVAEYGFPAIVLEDDAVVVEPLIDDLPGLLDDLSYLNFELCYLAQRNTPGPKPLAGRHVHLVEDYHPLWTLAYLLSPIGARKLIATPWQDHIVPSDEMLPAVFNLNRAPQLNKVFATEPGLVLSSNQHFFTPVMGSVSSETEKSPPIHEASPSVLSFTVATERRVELTRLLDSGRRYGLQIEVLGEGETWHGGEMSDGPGGGQKINLLRPALQKLPPAQPVLFMDGYDSIVTGHATDILRAWQQVCDERQPLFAAEVYCWPDRDSAAKYPETETPYRFLNSGAFIGTAAALLRIIEDEIADHEDDQRYYTQRFLSGQYAMCLDTRCLLFQCLNGALEDVQADEGRGMLYNQRTKSHPAVIHANGPSKDWLENAGRAVGGRWRQYYGEMGKWPWEAS